MENEWIKLLESSFAEMDGYLRASDWHGRENELVNLYAHRFLAGRVSAAGPLVSLRQVGIEVAVPQVIVSKKQWVRKDLVIWSEEDMTAWPVGGLPLVIIEWKRNNPNNCEPDKVWLRTFIEKYPATICYWACGVLTGDRGLKSGRVLGGQ